ncbi:MAG: threonine ammonia-lyase [Alphaproteobacteria bacterium]
MTDINQIKRAAEKIVGHVTHTQLISNSVLDQRTGAKVFLKPECLQKTGSFKYRGATNRILNLTEAEKKRGVVAVSSGNHGQAIAAVAKQNGVRATILMPADAPQIKVTATKRWGAEIVTFDRYKEDRFAVFAELIAKTGAVAIPPYDDPYVIAGQGTAGLESASDLVEMGIKPDLALVCCGGGGLTAGFSLAMKDAFPDASVYACEPENYDDTKLSLEAGTQIGIDTSVPSICDAIITPKPGELTFPINKQTLSGALVCSDDEALEAVAFAFEHLKLVVEPGGAIALAALLSGKIDAKGKTVVLTLSGGNIDPQMMQRALNKLD